MEIDGPDRVELEQTHNTLSGLSRAVLPKRVTQPSPSIRETNFVGIGVLYDEPPKGIERI